MRSIFISGGANGIGLATAKLFASRGWRVGIGDLRPPQTEAAGIAYHPLDVTRRLAWDDALAGFAGAGGAIDVVVNNAGVVRYGRFDAIPIEDNDLIVDVNLRGTIYGTHAALPYLRRASKAVLVNIASAGALYGGPDLAVYTATKFAVRGLSEALDAEFAPYGIGVRCVMPWFTESAMVRQAGTGRNASLGDDFAQHGLHGPEVPAGAVWDAVHGSALHYPVGRAKLVARLVRFLPGVMRRSSRAQVMKRFGTDGGTNLATGAKQDAVTQGPPA